MRVPLQLNSGRVRTARMVTIPPPTGGLNARDALSDMDIRDAYLLDNFFPDNGEVRVRRGSATYAYGLATLIAENLATITTESGDPLTTEGEENDIESLMVWNGQTGVSKMFAAGGQKIFNISTAGNYSVADITGLSNARWQYTNFGNSAGHFLSIVNGADTPRYYNGTTWANHTWSGSGLTQTDLVDVITHKNRLIYAAINKLGFWYAPVESINGTLTYFDLGPRFSQGGYLMGMASWSRDGGTGPEDYMVFVTSEGQAAVYQGDDPSSANDWALVGVYDISKPLGRRCFLKVGADLGYVGLDAVVSFNSVLPLDRSAVQKAAITNKIDGAIISDSRRYKSHFGWQLFAYPQGSMAILNVPVQENAVSKQYALNTNTGAWARFIGLDSICWALYNDTPYFGTAGGDICEFDTGNNDRGADINADMGTAYNRHGVDHNKQYGLVRAVYTSDGDLTAALAINTDYDNRDPAFAATYVRTSGSEWDADQWDEATWAGDTTYYTAWQSADSMGYVGSVRLNIKTNGQSVSVLGFNATYRNGGPL